MGAVASINIDYARIGDFDQPLPLDVKPLNPITVAQYCLYNREFPDFKLFDTPYLSYPGGFVTENDKITFKNSDLTIRRISSSASSAGGNLTVSGNANFFRNINLLTESGQIFNTVRNIRRLNNLEELNSASYNTEPIAIGDFKRFFFQPGMITWYNGTYENVVTNMPFWRVCGPPDSGITSQVRYADGSTGTITVPNLFSKFIPGGVPSDRTSALYKTGQTGGVDAVRLSIQEMPIHNHSVLLSTINTGAPALGGVTKFLNGSGTVTSANNAIARTCSYKSYSCGGCRCGSSNCQDVCVARCTGCRWRVCVFRRCWCVIPGSRFCCRYQRQGTCRTIANCAFSYTGAVNVTMVTSVTVTNYNFRRLKFSTTAPSITTQTEENRGSGLAHENRPMFYGLIPIIYVGVLR